MEGPPTSIAIYTLPLPPTVIPSQEVNLSQFYVAEPLTNNPKVTETSVTLTWQVDSIAPDAQIDLFAVGPDVVYHPSMT